MDEPLSNLDAKLREEARAWLRDLIVTMQLSALVVTHDQSESMAMSDRILLLNNGVIEQQGTPQEMYESPQTLFTADPEEFLRKAMKARRLRFEFRPSHGAPALASFKLAGMSGVMIRLQQACPTLVALH